ncbi:phosphate acyltransferase, partial [Acinetobacter baumannii]
YQTGMFMQPVFNTAKVAPQRVVYADGQDERVLRAVQFVADEGLAAPILVGQPAAIEAGIKKAGLRLKIGQNVQVIDPASDARVAQYAAQY